MRSVRRKTMLLLIAAIALSACKSSGVVIGQSDETEEAGEIVRSANADLKEIKKLYDKNENKREEIKQAMAADDVDKVQKLSNEVNDLINQGTGLGKSALDKIEQAKEMNVNEDYAEYLRLKWDALNKQMEAFDEYRQAALLLRNRYDPKNSQVRETVAAEFKNRSENYQRLMEDARDHSSRANELAKEVLQRKTEE